MKIGQDPNNPGLELHSRCHGYVVERIVELPETASLFYELRDPATAARHVHISCDDRENTFAVALKTVPRDSTGTRCCADPKNSRCAIPFFRCSNAV